MSGGQTVECRRCETPFNLDAQWYYDNLCPSCKADDDPDVTKPACTACGDRVDPSDIQHTSVVNPSARSGRETVVACSDECVRDLSNRRL